MSGVAARVAIAAMLATMAVQASAQEGGAKPSGEESIVLTGTRIPKSDPATATLLQSAFNYVEAHCIINNYSDSEPPPECKETMEAVTRLVGDVARAQLAERAPADAYNKRLFEMHEIATWFAFILAHVLVVVGALAAFGEFLRARRARKAGSEERVDIQIQLSGIAIRSATNGTIIMVATMAFYLAYLTFVYPIIG